MFVNNQLGTVYNQMLDTFIFAFNDEILGITTTKHATHEIKYSRILMDKLLFHFTYISPLEKCTHESVSKKK